MIYSLVLVRICAICLIVNAHLGVFYPDPRFGWGGYLGNGLFYLISGYGLALAQIRKPLKPLSWYTKRLTKILVPFVFYIVILHFGDWDKIAWTIQHNLIITTTDQLRLFFGVLWVLYVLFLPINRLRTKNLVCTLIAFVVMVTGLMLYDISQFNGVVPKNLATSDFNFLFNGIICFTLGILSARINVDAIIVKRPQVYACVTLLCVVGSQLLHRWFYAVDSRLIFTNFLFNIVCIYGLYMFFCLPWTKALEPYMKYLHGIAASSLAVYFVHFLMIDLLEHTAVAFPFNIIAVYGYSFIFAYPLTQMAVKITDLILNKYKRLEIS